MEVTEPIEVKVEVGEPRGGGGGPCQNLLPLGISLGIFFLNFKLIKLFLLAQLFVQHVPVLLNLLIKGIAHQSDTT